MKKNELDNLVRLFGSQVCYPEIRNTKKRTESIVHHKRKTMMPKQVIRGKLLTAAKECCTNLCTNYS